MQLSSISAPWQSIFLFTINLHNLNFSLPKRGSENRRTTALGRPYLPQPFKTALVSIGAITALNVKSNLKAN